MPKRFFQTIIIVIVSIFTFDLENAWGTWGDMNIDDMREISTQHVRQCEKKIKSTRASENRIDMLAGKKDLETLEDCPRCFALMKDKTNDKNKDKDKK